MSAAANMFVTTCTGCSKRDVPLKYSYENGDSSHFSYCNDCVTNEVHRNEMKRLLSEHSLKCTVCRGALSSLSWIHELAYPRLTNAPTFAKMACSARCHNAVIEFARQANDGLVRKECAVCRVDLEAPGKIAKLCTRCRAVRYCSVACQTQHWHASHKHVCEPVVTADAIRVTVPQESKQELLARLATHNIKAPPSE